MAYPDLTDITFNETRRRLSEDNDQRVLDSPVGESVFDRTAIATGNASSTQQLRMVGFTARATQNISQIRLVTGATAAGATPTLVRLGVYARDAVAGTYTQVAATPNDITLFAGASTTYNKAFTAPFLKTAGTDYLVAMLIVSAAAFPTFMAPVNTSNSAYLTDVLLPFPQLGCVITGQADLPASFTTATPAASNPNFHALLLQ